MPDSPAGSTDYRSKADSRGPLGAIDRREDVSVFPDIDNFFAGLYGLSQGDAEAIRGTLETALPYSDVRVFACGAAPLQTQQAFASRLAKVLRPFVRKHGAEVTVELWTPSPAGDDIPYGVLLVGTAGHPVKVPEEMFRKEVLPLANESGASRVIFELDGGLAVAVLNQRRYWTLSRARLCAAEIINRHMAVFQ